MPAIKSDLTIEQGTTWSHGWLVSYNGAPIDETWVARGQVREKVTSADELYEFDATVNDDGSVVIAVEPATSSAWNWRSGKYDIEVESTTGVVLRVSEGRVTVTPEVTR